MQCVYKRANLDDCACSVTCLHLQPQCIYVCYRLENHFIIFAKIVYKLIVSSNSVSLKGFSYEEIGCVLT